MLKMHLFTFQVYIFLLLVFCAKLSKSTLSYYADDKGGCDCGEGQVSCRWSLDYKKICECKDGYAFDSRDIVNKCFSCKNWCNENARTCDVSSEGTVNCICKNGFELEQISNQCMPCDCGPHGNCSYTYDIHTKCTCEEGYEEDRNRRCSECICKTAGDCYFDMYGRKRCGCPDGYKEKKGDCGKCDCGLGMFCYFDKNDMKVCACTDKQYEENGICKNCNCALDVGCELKNGIKTCLCPDGFEDVHGQCIDIDECLNSTACPATSVCLNTNGSFECFCKQGYSNDYNDVKKYGCEDINECKNDLACFEDFTKCVNTPGSYECQCEDGYIPEGTFTNPRENTCRKDYYPWIYASVGVAALLIIVFAALGILIVRKRRMNR